MKLTTVLAFAATALAGETINNEVHIHPELQRAFQARDVLITCVW